MVSLFAFPSSYFLANSVFIFAYGILCAATITLAYQLIRKCHHLNSSRQQMPGIKFPFWCLYGILCFLPPQSTMKRMSLPIQTYVHQIFSGLSTMFCNEKIIRVKFAYLDVTLLTKAESVEELLSSSVLATKPLRNVLFPFFGNGIFLSFGLRWKSQKKFLMHLFHQNNVEEVLPVLARESKVLVDILKRRQHEKWIDITEPVSLCAMDVVHEIFFGKKLGVQNNKDSDLVSAIQRSTETMAKRLTNPLYHFDVIFRLSALGRQFKKDIYYIRAFAEKVIQEKKEAIQLEREDKKFFDLRKSRNLDFLHLMLDLNKCNSEYIYSETDIRDELISSIFASQDTSSSGISFGLYLIGLYPDVQRKIQDELDAIFTDDPDRPVTMEDLKEMHYLECVIKECQRLYPTGPYNARYILEDFNLCGYKIKKGSIVVIEVSSLHRNPEVFPDPEVFDPERFIPEKCAGRSTYAYVPFSAGVRSCPGRFFGMVAMKTVIANVLRSLSVKSLEQRDKVCLSPQIVLRTVHPLKMKIIPRDIVLE